MYPYAYPPSGYIQANPSPQQYHPMNQRNRQVGLGFVLPPPPTVINAQFVNPPGVQVTYNPQTGAYNAYDQNSLVLPYGQVPIGHQQQGGAFLASPYAPPPSPGFYLQQPQVQPGYNPAPTSYHGPLNPSNYNTGSPPHSYLHPLTSQRSPREYSQQGPGPSQQQHQQQQQQPYQSYDNRPSQYAPPPKSVSPNLPNPQEQQHYRPPPSKSPEPAPRPADPTPPPPVAKRENKPQLAKENPVPAHVAASAPPPSGDSSSKPGLTNDAKQHKRDFALKELLSTEESYIDSLENLILVYKFPLERDPTIVLEPHQISTIFSNVEELLVVSKDLHLELKRRFDMPPEKRVIGDIYIEKAAEMKKYVTYINNYERSMQELQLVEEKYPNFFRNIQKDNQYSLDIQSLLIMPVQRIPRYELLLKNLLQNTNPDHLGYEDLTKALASIREINAYINNNKKLQDNQDRVVTIRDQLKGCPNTFVNPSRRWIKEGVLNTACSSKKYNGMFMVYLFNDIIVLAKPTLFSHKRTKKFEYLLEIHLNKSEFKMLEGGNEFRFISDPEGSKPLIFTFMAVNEKAKKSWIDDLKLLEEGRSIV
ncbi:hypothetical protein SAMD00019534_030260 [Acytostelium subglobosum LB1]|uniref:hypothetical protein n=1 Tax=Acytostelium subglobosum LB1 TaxID=1410327 RepID=UPI0006448DA0|nr:hypothetical protein SAMD00019534_030260 [Acytostelium subglobosum LB1]GAM19851.1 hypothetical protein SAMD00019534_030260 [Acytostelium subglobosum LB1]|eukprot:XP_012756613.1 hypothetical protein SAMD00019534_030260 [Acytostelium subglobosum LB1]